MAIEAYLAVDGIKGEVMVKSYKDCMQLKTVSFGGNNPALWGNTLGGGVGKVTLAPIVVTKTIDSASVLLFLAMCQGKHISTGKLSLVKAGAELKAYLTLEFTQLMITNMQTVVDTEVPTESVTMVFKQVVYTYFSQGPDGNLVASANGGWNIAKNGLV